MRRWAALLLIVGWACDAENERACPPASAHPCAPCAVLVSSDRTKFELSLRAGPGEPEHRLEDAVLFLTGPAGSGLTFVGDFAPEPIWKGGETLVLGSLPVPPDLAGTSDDDWPTAAILDMPPLPVELVPIVLEAP